MGELGIWRSLLLRGGLAAVLALVLQIGYACLQLSRVESPSHERNNIHVLWNPFFSSSHAKIQGIEEQAEGVRQRAPYETFLSLQTNDSRALVESVRQKINQRPFSSKFWSELVWAESLAPENEVDRLASIEAAIKISGWNHQYYLKLTAFCLESPPLLLQYNPRLCRSLLTNMPHASLALNARGMGVQHVYLKSRVEELSALYDLKSVERGDSRVTHD